MFRLRLGFSAGLGLGPPTMSVGAAPTAPSDFKILRMAERNRCWYGPCCAHDGGMLRLSRSDGLLKSWLLYITLI